MVNQKVVYMLLMCSQHDYYCGFCCDWLFIIQRLCKICKFFEMFWQKNEIEEVRF